MSAVYNGNTACLAALIQAKADIDHQDGVVRLGADVLSVLLRGPHDAMFTNVPNVSLFDLPIHMHAVW